MRPMLILSIILTIFFCGILLESLGQGVTTDDLSDLSYILNSRYRPGTTYRSKIEAEMILDLEMGKEAPVLRDKRIRIMAVTLASENGSLIVPFKLSFSDFQESSAGELSDPELDIIMDTKIAGATGDIENGHLVIKNICGIEPRYLDDMQDVLKPVFELAYLHFPKKAMKLGDSFQNRFGVDYPVGGFGTVETTQDMTITLTSIDNNIAKLNVETIVNGTFIFEGVAFPVTGSGTILLTLDIENQYFTSVEKNHTDIISFVSGGSVITIRSTEIYNNKTVIALNN